VRQCIDVCMAECITGHGLASLPGWPSGVTALPGWPSGVTALPGWPIGGPLPGLLPVGRCRLVSHPPSVGRRQPMQGRISDREAHSTHSD
jgi:hypothetical protein